ncbi:uncharacterized protein LOC125478991 [Pyrus x bretschneideri]|uniref:uncharacterized protein LOC125478991 n=1 Tax=Pyrus x bretschneideri TaxID=225117 RepID=UPI00202FB022|nr:uncharacterized protein LOC125478991 [Pyrus x bretschneideri]
MRSQCSSSSSSFSTAQLSPFSLVPHRETHSHKSWISSLCFLCFSLGIIWAIRYKSNTEEHLEKLLEKENEDKNLLEKCIEELKKKGLEFDLLKEVDALRRAKSLRVEAKVVRKWNARDFVTLFFFIVSCFVIIVTRVCLLVRKRAK